MDEVDRRIMLAQSSGNLELEEGGETTAVAAHDAWCPRVTRNQPCSCDPDIQITDAKGRTVQVFGDGTTMVVAEPMRLQPTTH